MTTIILLLTKKMSKEQELYWLGIYNNIKILINIVISVVAVTILNRFSSYSKVTGTLLTIGLYIGLTSLDACLIYKRIKRIRKLESSVKEYFISFMKSFLIMMLLFLGMGKIRKIVGNTSDFIFVFVCILGYWFYNLIWPYVTKAVYHTKPYEMKENERIYKHSSKLDNRIKYFIYEGIRTKSANVFVTGLKMNRSIFISDYFIQNATQDEIEAVLGHELGHVKYHDLEKRCMLMSIGISCFLALTYGMDYIETNVFHINIILGMVFLISIVVLVFIVYRQVEQRQELRADRYSVTITGNRQVLADAIEKLYQLNDSFLKKHSFLRILSTHPQLKIRIERLLEVKT